MSESGKEGGFVQKLVEGGKDAVAPTVVLRSPACCSLAICVSWSPGPGRLSGRFPLLFLESRNKAGPSAEWSLWVFPPKTLLEAFRSRFFFQGKGCE